MPPAQYFQSQVCPPSPPMFHQSPLVVKQGLEQGRGLSEEPLAQGQVSPPLAKIGTEV